MRSTMPDGFKKFVKTFNKLTVKDLADTYQVTTMTIYNWLKLVKLGRLNRPRSNGVDKGKMKTLLDEGKSAIEIAGILKCSNTTVKNFKRGIKNGIA